MPRAVLLPAICALASSATPPAFAAPYLVSRDRYAQPLSPLPTAAGRIDAYPDLRFDPRSRPEGAGHLFLQGIAEPLELLVWLVPAVGTLEGWLPPAVRSSSRRALRLAAHGYLLHELRKLAAHRHTGPPSMTDLHRRVGRSGGGRWEAEPWEWVAVGAVLATAAVGVTLLLRGDRDQEGEPNHTRGALAEMIFGSLRLSLNNDRGWVQIRGSW